MIHRRALAALLLLAVPAAGTVIAPLSLADLTARSSHIVVGRVVGLKPEWVGNRAAIVTRVTVLVSESVKGPIHGGVELEFLREGGELDGLGMLVHGSASFVVGEEALLFLEPRPHGLWTTGMSQGKWPVVRTDGTISVQRPSSNQLLPLVSVRQQISDAR